MKLRDKAYDSFTDNLLSRRILPGQFVTQRELSALTGMPLGAIRELIPRLEADGLLNTVPQRGMQITHIDINLIRNAFQLRSILELEAAAQFALHASDADRARLEKSHQDILDQAEHGLTEALADKAQEVDWAFHDTLIEHLQNQIISDVYRVNSIKIRLIRQELSRIQPKIVLSVMASHMTIIEALNTRDPDKAKAALAAHLDESRRRALQS
ncbi:MAG: GntR family transcriptional regulator [Rhodobacteraceae bacterium]|nr:MAG: GntR family transcriptional regulator [Paracoccaceae bacterium]